LEQGGKLNEAKKERNLEDLTSDYLGACRGTKKQKKTFRWAPKSHRNLFQNLRTVYYSLSTWRQTNGVWPNRRTIDTEERDGDKSTVSTECENGIPQF
jgi:hypothetical protein